MPPWLSAGLAIQASYFVTAVLFIVGLKRMSSPVTARSGILWAGAGMAVATLVTFLYPGMSNYALILPAASSTPMKPMLFSSGVCAPPSATIAPTSTMPCTKLDPDISGVCRMTGTREMTS